MSRLRFPIDSDLLELLVAFADAGGLQQLAKAMARDSSVVSRGLARLGDAGLLAKKDRKWALTPAGKKLVKATRDYVRAARTIVAASQADGIVLPANACLLIINAQVALQSPQLGLSSNPRAVQNLTAALAYWRAAELPVIHVRHVSRSAKSPFHKDAPGAQFMAGLEPQRYERVVDKGEASAFNGTDLAKHLDRAKAHTVVLAGFTAHECIDATAKHASALGLEVWVLSDAIAQFAIKGPSGKMHAADDVHDVVVAGLGGLATFVTSRELSASRA